MAKEKFWAPIISSVVYLQRFVENWNLLSHAMHNTFTVGLSMLRVLPKVSVATYQTETEPRWWASTSSQTQAVHGYSVQCRAPAEWPLYERIPSENRACTYIRTHTLTTSRINQDQNQIDCQQGTLAGPDETPGFSIRSRFLGSLNIYVVMRSKLWPTKSHSDIN